jgi:hypothetical protein
VASSRRNEAERRGCSGSVADEMNFRVESGGARRRLAPPRSGKELSGSAVTIRAVLFDQFVVNAHYQECWGPLTDEQRPIVLACDLEYCRSGHRGDRGAQIARRGQSGCLRFDSGGELVFTLPSHTCAGRKCHEIETPLGFIWWDDKGKTVDVMTELEFELVPVHKCRTHEGSAEFR